MLCDWIGAGKVYNKGKWSEKVLYDFWKSKRKTAKIEGSTKKYIDYLIDDIMKNGIDKGLKKEWTKDTWLLIKYHISAY